MIVTVLLLVCIVAAAAGLVLMERAEERDRINRQYSHEDWMD